MIAVNMMAGVSIWVFMGKGRPGNIVNWML